MHSENAKIALNAAKMPKFEALIGNRGRHERSC